MHAVKNILVLPLASTVASALSSTAFTLLIWPDSLRVVTPAVTSQTKTERSPPEDANFVLS
jgi:hypothetical protein